MDLWEVYLQMGGTWNWLSSYPSDECWY